MSLQLNCHLKGKWLFLKASEKSCRKKLHLKTGTQFVVVAENDLVILKNISAPTLDEFDGLIAKARKSAKKVGLKKADLKNAIAKVRSKK
jgi:hypothetical protein